MAVHKIDGGPGGQNPHYPKKFVTLYSADAATNAIAKGDWVSIDLGDSTNGIGMSVEQAVMGTATGDALCFGVATHALSVAGNLVVQTAGYYGHESGSSSTGATAYAQGTGAAVDQGTVAAGAALAAGAVGDPGEAMTYAAGTHTAAGIIGVALEAEGANNYIATEAPVLIIDQGLF